MLRGEAERSAGQVSSLSVQLNQFMSWDMMIHADTLRACIITIPVQRVMCTEALLRCTECRHYRYPLLLSLANVEAALPEAAL